MYVYFFFNDTATTEIYTLSLHDALPISDLDVTVLFEALFAEAPVGLALWDAEGRYVRVNDALAAINGISPEDRKSTRLNSSHANISYAVFCLKKKKT